GLCRFETYRSSARPRFVFECRPVHARGEIVAELLLDAAARPIRLRGQFLEEFPQLPPVRLAARRPPAPTLFPFRNGILRAPRAVGERVEVVARVRGSVQVAGFDPFQRGGLGGGERGDANEERDHSGDDPRDARGAHAALLEEVGTSRAAITVAVST